MDRDNEQKEKEIKPIGYPLKTTLVSPLVLPSVTVLTFFGLPFAFNWHAGR